VSVLQDTWASCSRHKWYHVASTATHHDKMLLVQNPALIQMCACSGCSNATVTHNNSLLTRTRAICSALLLNSRCWASARQGGSCACWLYLVHVAAELLIVPLKPLHKLLWGYDSCLLLLILYLQAPAGHGCSWSAPTDEGICRLIEQSLQAMKGAPSQTRHAALSQCAVYPAPLTPTYLQEQLHETGQ
jgi:hypothetical protein